jgi:lipopolysaccharide transport system permease protein
MFGTSVLFSADNVGGVLGVALRINPMTPIIDSYRNVLLLNAPPPLSVLSAALIALIGLWGAWIVFHRTEFKFAENI